MRPARRGLSPNPTDFSNYNDAKTELISRLGSGWINGEHVASYCSYCERKVDVMLAVEHIQPKDGPHGQPQLHGRWSNFLLACVNCNSTKGSKRVVLADIFLPDRDNTFAAFEYLPDGNIVPHATLDAANRGRADETLTLTGLSKAMRQTFDDRGRLIAEDRASQRMQAFGVAEVARADLHADPHNDLLKRYIVNMAVLGGFFSVWMVTFDGNAEMRNLLVDAFGGTRESGCFNPATTAVVSPAPNADGLANGGKV